MALRQVLLSYKIGEKKTFIEALREKSKDFEQRKAEMNKREADLEAAINEQTPDTDAETKAAVEKAVEEFTEEAEKLEEEIKQNAEEIASVEAEVAEMQKELDALSETPAAPEEPPAEPENRETNKRSNERSFAKMKVRAFDKMNLQERAALVAREDVKKFITRVTEAVTNKVMNAEITVPTVLRPMIREEVAQKSKLLKHVNHIYIPGDARIPIMGEIPEAIWTEQCAKLNELGLEFYMVEINAYKVGGFMGVCRYIVEDSAENILDILMYALAAGIAKAIDKAILFGTGNKMPLGIVTRLLQTVDPGNGGKYERPWVNLSATNALQLNDIIEDTNGEPEKIMQGIVMGFGAAETKTGTDNKFFAMHSATYTTLLGALININSSGAIVSGMNMTMPVIGGDIEIIDDMPVGLIVGGYGINYTAGERGNMTFDTNDRLRWIEEQVLVKATARYDGKPTNPAAFVALSITDAVANLAAEVTFAPDTAN